jgi:ABC-type bacteriocin/lantibiotic exporter with double-glycine peptidase domain
MGMGWTDVVADVIVVLVASAIFAFAVAACVFFVSIFTDALLKIATTRTLATLFGFVACIAVFTVKRAGE